MKNVTILMLEQGMQSTVSGPMEVFQLAGVAWNYLTGQAMQPQFKVSTASIDGKPVTGFGGLVVTPQYSISQIRKTDLVLVCSGGVDWENIVAKHASLVPWLKRRHARGATIAGICSGVALLAEAGLLDGKEATTHWGIVESLQQRYPHVQFRPNRLVTDEGSVLCSGGVNAALDLSLYLVAKYCGHDIAMQCAKSLLIETSRSSQSGFAVLSFDKKHDDQPVMAAQDWIEKNYAKAFSFDALANRMNMSTRNFMRRFKAATDDTPLVYLQRVRMAAAKRALENGQLSIEAISNRIGYEDVAFFRSLFRRHVGLNPKAYREKFGNR